MSEGNEVFNATLVATEVVDGLTIRPESAPVTIIDNDSKGTAYKLHAVTLYNLHVKGGGCELHMYMWCCCVALLCIE